MLEDLSDSELGTEGDGLEEPGLEEGLEGLEEELEGLRPNGQKSPPLGGRTQVRASPSLMSTKFDCRLSLVMVWGSAMNGAGVGTTSFAVQLGPRALMKEVLPNKTFD